MNFEKIYISKEMKILYGIQLTGNGHIKRSLLIIERLRRLGHQVDIIVSGKGSSLSTGEKWRFRGVTIYTNGQGEIDWKKTIFSLRIRKLLVDSIKVSKLDYDLVISDFEPVSTISAFLSRKKSITISNQTSILNYPGNFFRKLFIRIFTIGAIRLSLSYVIVNKDSFYSPLKVWSEVDDHDFILVYLPNFSHYEILKVVKSIDNKKLKIYYDCKSSWTFSNSIEFKKIDSENFMKDLAKCSGVITACGFSTTCEAIYLKKPIWAIPLKGQFEQEFNSKILSSRGVFTGEFTTENFKLWIDNLQVSNLEIGDDIERLLKRIEDIYEKG
jgi:uncharacterized protein (TIGR00661 family)